jgi:cell division protein FtsB
LYFHQEVLYRFLRVGTDELRIGNRRTAPPERSARRRRILRSLLLFVATVIVVDAFVGERGLLAMLRARRQHEELAASIERQRAENERLREEIRRLTDDSSAIEEIARRELGLIRPGEKVFIIKDLPQATKP